MLFLLLSFIELLLLLLLLLLMVWKLFFQLHSSLVVILHLYLFRFFLGWWWRSCQAEASENPRTLGPLGRRIDVFQLWCWRRLESLLDCKEIQPVHPKGNKSWRFIGRTDIEAETPIFWPPDAKSWLIWKDPDVGKDWGQEEKGTTEDELVRCFYDISLLKL